MTLVNKVALITGSSRGIGLAVAKHFLEAGARVMMSAEHDHVVPEVNELLQRYPDRARYCAANMYHDEAMLQLFESTWMEFHDCNLLVNNVGTFAEPDFLSLTRADFDRIMHLNVWSAVFLTQQFAQRLITQGRPGRILLTTSLNATRSEPGHTLYDASKGAMNALTRQWAVELAPYGITTAAIAPGLVETPLTDHGLRSTPSLRSSILEQIPLKKIATVEDIAPWFVFLASEASAYATGSVFIVDGGLDAQQMSLRPVSDEERGRLS